MEHCGGLGVLPSRRARPSGPGAFSVGRLLLRESRLAQGQGGSDVPRLPVSVLVIRVFQEVVHLSCRSPWHAGFRHLPLFSVQFTVMSLPPMLFSRLCRGPRRLVPWDQLARVCSLRVLPPRPFLAVCLLRKLRCQGVVNSSSVILFCF